MLKLRTELFPSLDSVLTVPSGTTSLNLGHPGEIRGGFFT
jgi:hypothetical protein